MSYWTPESTNQTARVALMQIPSREILRTVNLFQVSDCKMHWQSNGKLLCKVDRHTKSGKTIFSNLEFFKTNERDIPVEKLELKMWWLILLGEPNTERFITISRLDDGNPNPAIPKIPFHSIPEVTKGGVNHSLKRKVVPPLLLLLLLLLIINCRLNIRHTPKSKTNTQTLFSGHQRKICCCCYYFKNFW